MTNTSSKTGAISRASSQAAAAEAATVERARRQRAARDATRAAPAEPARIVACRVLPLGCTLISTGEHVAGIGEACFEKGDTFRVAEDIAQALQTRGLVEITPEPAPEAADAE